MKKYLLFFIQLTMAFYASGSEVVCGSSNNLKTISTLGEKNIDELTKISLLFHENIKGLNQEQINQLNKCLKARGLDIKQIENWDNNADLGSRNNSKHRLFHNFIFNSKDPRNSIQDAENFNNGIFVSGSIITNEKLSFNDSVLANMTFIGDFSKLDFKGACLVNVRFYKASTFDLIRIKFQSAYNENISN